MAAPQVASAAGRAGAYSACANGQSAHSDYGRQSRFRRFARPASDVRVAHDGLLGIETANQLRPEVAIIDLGMPRLNGYEACRSIREQPWGKDIVLIALTGWGQEAREAGFDAHLVKPASPDLVLREVNRQSRRAGDALSA